MYEVHITKEKLPFQNDSKSRTYHRELVNQLLEQSVVEGLIAVG